MCKNNGYTLTYKIMNHACQEYLVPAFDHFFYTTKCVRLLTSYTVVSQKRTDGWPTLQVCQRGEWVFPHLTMKDRPCHVYRDSMPLKQIIVMCNRTTSGFEVLMAHNTLNGNMSPSAWRSSLCTPYYQRPSMQICIVTFGEVLHKVSYLRYAQHLRLCFSNSIQSSLKGGHSLFAPIQDIGPKVGSWA